MIRCGELCSTCVNYCRDSFSGDNYAEIECVVCEGTGEKAKDNPCESCNGKGYWKLTSCPRDFVGTKITEAINLSGYAKAGFLPNDGGILDQDAYWLSVWTLLERDQNNIEVEQRKRKSQSWQT